MKLILFHGPPSAGKTTVSGKLAQVIKAPLIDNHIAIDIARSVFGSTAPGFWDLVHDVRVATLRAAARAHVPVLITSAAYNHPDDLNLLKDYENAVAEFGGSVDYVYLSCSEKTLLSRVDSPDRIQRGKLSTKDGLKKCLAEGNYLPVPREACLQLSTDANSPIENARAVAHHFDLASEQ